MRAWLNRFIYSAGIAATAIKYNFFTYPGMLAGQHAAGAIYINRFNKKLITKVQPDGVKKYTFAP